MLCPEGAQIQSEADNKEAEDTCPQKTKAKKVLAEGSSGSLELGSFKNPKTWKKSISNFFRNQLRSTKSNDGDPAGSQDNFEEKEISPEQKWQSLGKIFRRQSFVEPWNGAKAPSQHGESSSPNKRLAVRKVLSSYFGKSQKSPPESDDK